MRYVLLLVTVVLFSSCVAPPVTPVVVLKYPDTWTPAPTATNTPPLPTATLVVQHTPGPPPTRDPNLRILPTVPTSGIGVWLDTTTLSGDMLKLIVPRAQILVTNGVFTTTQNAKSFVVLGIDVSLPTDLNSTLPSRYDGVLLENANDLQADALSSFRARVAPRLLLRSVEIPQVIAANAVTQTLILGNNVDGVCYCNFLKEPDTQPDLFRTEAEWLHDVQTLAALSSSPNAVILTATRFPDGSTKDFDLMQGWLDYALGSYLLGMHNTHTFFGFQGGGAQEFMAAQGIVAKIGRPIGELFRANGVYQRLFTRGLALVNPTNETRAFAPSRSYVNLNSAPIPQIKMTPHSGLILLLAR